MHTESVTKKLVIIGGGAGGIFCAVNAAASDVALNVTVLEKSGKLLSKVRISGGGRCNVTHACDSIAEMVKYYPRGTTFLKKAFRHFFTADTVRWFSDRRVNLKTESDGRIFPVSDSSETIISTLLAEAEKHHVQIRLNADVQSIRPVVDSGRKVFRVRMRNGQELTADFVCIAVGGFPRLSQYDWISALGHTINHPAPSLFTFNVNDESLRQLMGVSLSSVKVRIKGINHTQSGPLLITHWGLSGPAILKLSAYAAIELSEREYQFQTIVNWLDTVNEQSALEQLRTYRNIAGRRSVGHKNPFGLPSRLWDYHLKNVSLDADTRWADVSAKQQNLLAKNLTAQEYSISGKTTFKEEFVTAGGVSLQEISPDTMESKLEPGIYFAGEIMNVDGITGGFNFQHAWTSGFVAAKAISAAATREKG